MTTSQIASTIVTLVEKHLGTGFDPVTGSVLVETVAEYLEDQMLGTPAFPARQTQSAVFDLDHRLSHTE
jgi:hypothetical protein